MNKREIQKEIWEIERVGKVVTEEDFVPQNYDVPF